MIAKIYKIIPKENAEDGDVYYGSTTQQYISHRMTAHRNDYKLYLKGERKHRTTSFDLFDKYGLENCKIELVEEFEYLDEIEIRKKEREYIDKNKCVNADRPIITKEEKKEYFNKWYEEHKNDEKVMEDRRKADLKYKELNRDKINQRKREKRAADKLKSVSII